jgi:hypothetical protein
MRIKVAELQLFFLHKKMTHVHMYTRVFYVLYTIQPLMRSCCTPEGLSNKNSKSFVKNGDMSSL